jgi:hypothetical protein
MEFRDPGCMKAHLPGSGLSRIATNINKETAISWLQDPKAARTKVEDLKIPKDESAQGLCTPSRGSVSYSYLVQYVIRQGAIAAVIQSYMWPDSC